MTGQLERRADDFDQAPAGDGLDADLYRVADNLVLDAGQRAEHQLVVVGMHEAQPQMPTPSDMVRPNRRSVGAFPGNIAILVDDDDAVGKLDSALAMEATSSCDGGASDEAPALGITGFSSRPLPAFRCTRSLS